MVPCFTLIEKSEDLAVICDEGGELFQRGQVFDEVAEVFLGEDLALYHLWGIGLVLSGVILATWPKKGIAG